MYLELEGYRGRDKDRRLGFQKMRWCAYKAVPLAVALMSLTVAGAAGALGSPDARRIAPASVASELLAGDAAVLRLPDARASTAWMEGRQGERRAPAIGQAAELAAVATLWLVAGLGVFCSRQFRPSARGNPQRGRAPPLLQLV